MSKYQHIFDTTEIQSDINNKSIRSGAVTMLSQVIMFILQLGSTMVLARILSPHDYGINAMALAITGFANIFGYLGLSTATIQQKEVTHEQVSALFWVNFIVGLILTLIVASLAPVAVWFYKTPEMLWVMLTLSIVFTINGLAIQHNALLKRQMRFYAVAKIQVLSMFAGIIVAIVAGYYGLGYWALVLNTLTNVICNAVGSWLFCRWIPSWYPKKSNIKSMIQFGADIVGYNVISYFSRNLDTLLIGKYHGSGALGLYSKAYQLLMMPITNLEIPMSTIAMPAMSSIQYEVAKFRNYYAQYLSLLAFISMPLVVLMFVCSDLIIGIILGPQWLGASSLFKILSAVAFLQPVFSSYSLVLLSLGKSRKYFKVGIFYSVFISISFFVGLPWGASGVAIAYACAFYILLIPMMILSFKRTPIDLKLFFASISRPFIASMIMGLCSFGSLSLLGNINDFVALLITCISGAVCFILSFVLLPGGKCCLESYFNYSKKLLKKC